MLKKYDIFEVYVNGGASRPLDVVFGAYNAVNEYDQVIANGVTHTDDQYFRHYKSFGGLLLGIIAAIEKGIDLGYEKILIIHNDPIVEQEFVYTTNRKIKPKKSKYLYIEIIKNLIKDLKKKGIHVKFKTAKKLYEKEYVDGCASRITALKRKIRLSVEAGEPYRRENEY